MKIWERICKEDTNNRVKTHTREGIRSWLYVGRTLPCEVEIGLFHQGDVKSFENCNCDKHHRDCLQCLDEYLDLEDMLGELRSKN